MGILTFVIVLVLLIVVHELGHFVAAKLSGMRVDEFGLGYPPKLFGKKVGETEYTLNALPFGGFVRIYGEDAEQDNEDAARAFVNRPRILQAIVLVAGVAMNILLAWVLLAGVLFSGAPRAIAPEDLGRAQNVELTLGFVQAGTPADEAGFMAGDVVQRAVADGEVFEAGSTEGFANFIAESESSIEVTVLRNGEAQEIVVTPEEGITANPDQRAIGVQLTYVGEVSMGIFEALGESFVVTGTLLRDITIGISVFLAQAITLQADFSTIAGPVGIAGIVSDASESGWVPLLMLTAIISLNLAIINMIPIPALDGGRLLFVIIESIIRRPIPKQVTQATNAVGMLALLLLMVVVTISDIAKLL